ncbi:MAG: restriction endonuclease [Deltaproteobacteria bacterium]|nr:restriction endonuclease [Deltaproteobacteria bacterium]
MADSPWGPGTMRGWSESTLLLRSVGKPLHYKKITEIAIERNLLSHVGKTPETTMSSRLATMVKKDRGDAPITKVKPGVFALRDLPDEAVQAPDSAAEPNDAPEAAAADGDTADVEASSTADGDTTPDDTGDAEPSVVAQDLPGADVFPEEDDDDELILANLDDDSREGRKPRKRRPRRRRERDSEGGSSVEGRSERRSPPRSRSRKEPQAPATRAAQAGEPVGRDLADAIETSLRGRSRQTRTLVQLAEALIDTGRLAGAPALLAPTLGAAIRGDNAKRQAAGGRPRFREGDGLVSLMEWSLPSDAVNAERDAVRAADRQRQSVRRAFVKRLHDLPDGALLELLATWLNAVGVQSLRAVRADVGDFSLAGTLRRGPEETPLAITIYRGKQPISNDAVVALRGGLHHFDHARMGWVITLGQVRDGTVIEAHAEGAAPCALFDGDALAASMEEVGVGIRRASLPLSVLDVDLLDSLGDAPARANSSSARNHSNTNGDDNTDSDGTRRRRSRRRGGRRRGGSDEAGAEGTETAQNESTAASEMADTPESTDAEPVKVESESTSNPEPPEDKEKKSAEPAPAPEVEAE